MENDRKKPLTDLKELLAEHIDEKRDNKMLIIFGQPGIGKSTLITWIMANFNDRINEIFVYKFASDLGNVDWKNDRISNRILDEIGLKSNDLNGKILILDGFDEVGIESNRRRDILDNLYDDWIYDRTIDNFSLIIICRENYVQRFAMLKCKYITLQPWDEVQIKSFCSVFQEKTKSSISDGTLKKLFKSKDILGIPLILYMVLALDISIEEEGSIVDIYDKIFSLDGGIYDRCIDNKSFADKHRIGKIKRQIHQMSREIAIWIFENNPDKAYIPQEEYKKICDKIKQDTDQKDIDQDFVIGNFFELKYCEGEKGDELYFIHRSIYEYFVAESIYSSIENSIKNLSDESQEELAGNIAVYLKQGEITQTIGDYLQNKIVGLYNQLSAEKKNRFYDWWELTVAKIIKNGMFYYVNNLPKYKNYLSKEIKCFINLIDMSRIVSRICGEKYIMNKVDRKVLERYIKFALIEYKTLQRDQENSKELDLSNMCLKGVDLGDIDLMGVNFSYVDFSGTNLVGMDFSNLEFRGTNFQQANLSYVDFSKSFLVGANLQEANLIGTNLEEAYMINICLDRAIFCNTEIEGTYWYKEDIENICSNLHGVEFSYILVKDGDSKKKIFKEEFFEFPYII